MTPQDIINEARNLLQDTDSTVFRQSNDELLDYVNDALNEASHLAPNLFFTTGDLTCVSGQTEQTLTFSDAQGLVEVIRIKDGKAVHPMDMMVMSRFHPEWAAEDAGEAINWCRFAGDPLRFYLYPKAPVNQVIEVIYVKNPSTYALTDSITELPPASKPALANYVIYRAESKDDEHVNSQRAIAHYNLFSGYFKPTQ